MIKRKEKKKKSFGPILTILILTLIIMITSFVLSLFGIGAQTTAIVNGNLETSLETVNSVFSVEGLKFLIGNAAVNFKMFNPLVILIISLIGVSIADASGLIKALVSPMKKIKINVIIFLTLLVSLVMTFLGDYSYLIMLPLIGSVYKNLGKNPILGVITVFLGITIGYGTGFIFNYNDYLLGNLTALSAKIDVDPNYQFHLLSNSFITIIISLFICIIGTLLISKKLIYKLPEYKTEEKDDIIISKKALLFSNVSLVIMLLLIIYMIIPGFKGSGILLDNSQKNYIAKLYSDTASFKEGIAFLITIVLMICSLIYGKISKNIKNSNQYSLGLFKSFEGLGFVFVLLFFLSLMIGILNWTNLDDVIANKLINFMSSLQFSGVPLIITLFIFVIIISILIPTTLDKWILMSPFIVPLFMRSNITPDFTLFVFKIADGIGKCFTPLYSFFIILLAFIQKYNNDDKYEVTIFGTLKLIMPLVLIMAGLLLLVVIGWYIIGLPTGINAYPTL